jgi:predicted TIM-barrel fold metal-dependent hydrolase
MRTLAALALLLLAASCKKDPAPAPRAALAAIPRIDVHTHLGSPKSHRIALGLADRHGIRVLVNLSGMSPGRQCQSADGPVDCLDLQVAMARQAVGRVYVFTQPDWSEVLAGPGYGERLAANLRKAKEKGAIGLKIAKALGLGVPTPDRSRALPVDDPGLDPLWRAAGELKMPVAIHVGDPKAFWEPVTPANERWDELAAHPGWSNVGPDGKLSPGVPTWEEIYSAFERLVARHPGTTFIGVHFGNAPEDPARVARLLDRCPNFFVDTAARVPEIGRKPAAEMRALFEKYQDRILFGTDLGVGDDESDVMLGSTDGKPVTPAAIERFFGATFRYFETGDRQFEHPTPIQGRWKIDGLGLSREVLEKLYWKNATRVLGIALPAERNQR